MMRHIGIVLFAAIFIVSAYYFESAHKRLIKVPVKSALQKYRPALRMPASDSPSIKINGKEYILRKDMTVSDRESSQKQAFASFGSKHLIAQSPGASDSRGIQVLQSKGSGKYALLFPKVKLRSDDFFSTKQWLADNAYQILSEFPEIGVLVVQSQNVSQDMESFELAPGVSKVEPIVVENRVVPR